MGYQELTEQVMDAKVSIDPKSPIDDCIWCGARGAKWLMTTYRIDHYYQVECLRCNMCGPTNPTFNGASDIYNEGARIFAKKLIRGDL